MKSGYGKRKVRHMTVPFFFFSVARPLALVLVLALAFGILLFVEFLVTREEVFDFAKDLTDTCAALALAVFPQVHCTGAARSSERWSED